MDIFAIKKGNALNLSVDEFEKQTSISIPIIEQRKMASFHYMLFAQNVEIRYRS